MCACVCVLYRPLTAGILDQLKDLRACEGLGAFFRWWLKPPATGGAGGMRGAGGAGGIEI